MVLDFQIAGRAPTAEELRDTKIVIGNRTYPASTHHIPNMLEGTYPVSFQHPDYIPVDLSVVVSEGKVASASANLQPRPGHLTIHATPIVPIAVYLNNLLLSPSADGTYPLPPNQADKVQVAAQNFAGAVRDFKPSPNQPLSWDVSLSVMPPAKTGQDYQIPYLGMELKWIPPGNYTMGSPGGEIDRKSSEGPITNVIIPVGFWAGRFEVTQAQYQAVMGENPSAFGHDAPDRFPVEMVSWFKAREFAQKLTEREKAAGRLLSGYEYRLPTEAEWEYFARAGTTTPFNFGDHADSSNGNFKGSYPPGSSSETTTSLNTINGTQPVGSYTPNAWGLSDVHGNVAEWVLDAFRSHLPGDTITAPAAYLGDDSSRRVYRGGGWSDYARDARSAWRDPSQGVRPETTSNQIGLRIVLAPAISASK
jgi:formylglycine-generating enzyme required for sulfatase activity